MPDQTLLLLLDEVRGKTLRILDAVPAEQARWVPPGLDNHVLWHAGHAYVVVEMLTLGALGQAPVIPDGWFEMFSWESRPARVSPDHWPSLAEVIARLRTQQGRLRQTIDGLSGEQLDRPSARIADRTVRSSILHGLHDEACHCGETLLLLKLQARSRESGGTSNASG
jgi:hypothetical protein